MSDDQFPGWYWGPDGGEPKVFKSADEVPAGWYDSPQKAAEHAAKKGGKKATKDEAEHDL